MHIVTEVLAVVALVVAPIMAGAALRAGVLIIAADALMEAAHIIAGAVLVAEALIIAGLTIMAGALIIVEVTGMEVSGLDQDWVGMDGHGGVSHTIRTIHIPLLLPSSSLLYMSSRHRNSRSRVTGITAGIPRAIIHMCNNVPEAG